MDELKACTNVGQYANSVSIECTKKLADAGLRPDDFCGKKFEDAGMRFGNPKKLTGVETPTRRRQGGFKDGSETVESETSDGDDQVCNACSRISQFACLCTFQEMPAIDVGCRIDLHTC